jgi:hypothetical protein
MEAAGLICYNLPTSERVHDLDTWTVARPWTSIGYAVQVIECGHGSRQWGSGFQSHVGRGCVSASDLFLCHYRPFGGHPPPPQCMLTRFRKLQTLGVVGALFLTARTNRTGNADHLQNPVVPELVKILHLIAMSVRGYCPFQFRAKAN